MTVKIAFKYSTIDNPYNFKEVIVNLKVLSMLYLFKYKRSGFKKNECVQKRL